MTPGETVTEFLSRVQKLDLPWACELLAPDVHYDNVPMAPIDGRDAVRDTLQGFMGSATAVEWRVLRQTETANIVMNERLDRFEINGKWLEIPCAGVWEINAEGLISLWRDYFDLKTFVDQMS
jgi:limonene-1,2-epoxide hydrolase